MYLLGVIQRADHIFFFFYELLIPCTSQVKLQGFAVEAPSDGWCITFALGRLGKLIFFIRSKLAWASWIAQFKSTEFSSIFLN